MRNRAIHVLIGQNQHYIEIPETPRKTLTFLIKYFQRFEKQFRSKNTGTINFTYFTFLKEGKSVKSI